MQLLKRLNQVSLDAVLRLLFLDKGNLFDLGESQFERVIRLGFEFFLSMPTNVNISVNQGCHYLRVQSQFLNQQL